MAVQKHAIDQLSPSTESRRTELLHSYPTKHTWL